MCVQVRRRPHQWELGKIVIDRNHTALHKFMTERNFYLALLDGKADVNVFAFSLIFSARHHLHFDNCN